MSYRFSDEQEELRQLVRRFLAEKSPSEEVRHTAESPHSRDERVWKQMADQLGLQGIAIPEEYGGVGYGPMELGIVLEEMGRRLLVAPYFSTVALAGQALVALPDEAARRRWLPGIADGSLTATLAVTDDGESWDPGSAQAVATPDRDRWMLNGTKRYVVDGHTSGLLLVVARVADGIGLFAVEADASGLITTALESVDLTRDLADVVLKETPATRIEGVDLSLLTVINDRVLAALACEQIGGAARVLDMAVEYASVREQFGKPIGSFQAIKHKCADLLLQVESGKAAAYQATALAQEAGRESTLASAVAKAWCSETYVHAAKENIQIHGGIGYTWEHDAHLYLRRATSSDALFGAAGYHRDRLATLIGI